MTWHEENFWEDGVLTKSGLRQALTVDNWTEFAEHAKLTCRLGLPIYFTDAYSSWQRGTNENSNGLL